MFSHIFRFITRSLLFLPPLLLLGSCSSLLTTTFIEPTVANLQKQNDLDLVCEGSPAYLLMIDSMIASKPESPGLLQAGAQAYSGYIAAMAECRYPPERIRTVADKAHIYGKKLVSTRLSLNSPEKFDHQLDTLDCSDVPRIFWGTLAWLNWIQQQEGAPAAMADLVIIEKIMKRLLELDESYQAGAAHLFWGGYYATRPPMFGGDPEKSRYHFERAMELSNRSFLLIHTTYAETLARQLFDQELHDSLLREVINFQLQSAPDYTLSNQIAIRKAKRLLDENFFAE